MTFKLYNTLSRTVQDFIPNDEKEVKMYTCGPTVYHFAHIGNLRSYTMHDVLEKSLNYLNYKVNRVMNITDVGHLSGDTDTGEDKMLIGAQREHKTVLEIAKMYTEAFKKDCERLNIKWPDTVVPATSCVPDFIKIIEGLLNKGYAYISGGNVYFDVSKLKDYYVLTNHQADEMVVGARDGVESDNNKRNQNDFALWFTKSKFADQELKWDSPWGLGYPGWHIECSGICLKHLGDTLDIHCGGVDNIFPHHTNEIAQTESFTGKKWTNYWFHVQHLNTEIGKMSKSSGEFLTVDLLVKKGYNPLVYRLFCLQSHYRKPLVFSWERLDGAVSTYKKLKSKIQKLLENKNGEINYELAKNYQNKFAEAISSDLNTSLALTCVYDVIKDDNLNSNTMLYLLEDFDKVLSLDLLKPVEVEETSKEIDSQLKEHIEQKIEERKLAKQSKDYAKADAIRNELLEKGIILKDTPNGTEYSFNN